MTAPRIIRDQYVYPVKARATGAGLAITIPVDVARTLGIEVGDSMALVLLDDGFVVSKIEGDEQ
jgi:antitoxin component of MazEF toxin-antitoxin module